ncbi:MAG: electron-transfer flavoprotein:ubiquinone oxidoreductase [Gemmatimonadales bacterium]
MAGRLIPADHQPPLPRNQLVLTEAPGEERIDLDVVFVGAGPAGLAGAIHLAQLVKQGNEAGDGPGDVSIGVLEKAASLGEHCLSGAVINPRPFRELFPDLQDSDFPFGSRVEKESVYLLSAKRARRIPTPPTMKNHGNYVVSICEVVRWLGERAGELGVDVFAGFPAGALLTEGDRVTGVRTVPSGLDRDGNEMSNYMPPADIVAKVTALSEGTRGMLAQAYFEWQAIGSENPQVYALGVKELWELRRPLDRVIHTMGWPLPGDAFGGSWMYPLEPKVVSLGLVVGLDYPYRTLDVHDRLQRLKQHPLFEQLLRGGELVEWGAKTIPEGGYHALPERLSGDGVVILGDSAGFVDVPSLKGIHYAVQSGIYAARAIYEALKADDTSRARLGEYDRLVTGSYIRDDLYRTRNMRPAFKSGFWKGGIKAALMSLTGGRFPGKRIDMEEDAAAPRRAGAVQRIAFDNRLTFSKVDAVFKAGNATRDTIPQHLIVGENVPAELAEFYAHMCPAGVYEVSDGKLVVNAPNCVDCKATDVVGPRWTPREGGAGPSYKRM